MICQSLPRVARCLRLARIIGPVCLTLLFLTVPRARAAETASPLQALGADGKPLNLDFENGTLKDWSATGDAFDGQPIKGDTVAARRSDMKSHHQGNYWIGGYEIKQDDGMGTLTSVAFPVTHRWASFLVGGGHWAETRVELLRADTHDVFFKVSGTDDETLRPVVVDLQAQMGKPICIRLVDQRKGGWGHINFDDFVFYDQRPQLADVRDPSKPAQELLQPDTIKFAGLKPEDAVKAMTLPPGFKATLCAAEPDIINPIAFTIDARGRLWVVQGLTYPVRAPEGQGKDSIIVFEDTNGDGKFDKRTVFAEGLNLVSGIEIGFGGVWVGAAPYLMFIPCDETADEPKPTGKPKILLDGFGYSDTHETLNTFTWGPDGWLYGCHGVFVESHVGKPELPKDSPERVHINAGIWRYHPTKHIFERFAEGTSNPWGFDFDEHGQLISEACVIPHLWHIVQNGRYMRQAGNHDNPYTFDDIKTIADHVHYAGNKGPHAGNGRSDAMGGGHAHAGLLVYQGDNWPAEFRGKYFMNNIHGARINMDVPEVQGSGFVGHHGKDFILFNDRASQIVNLRTGPDGGVYMIDWYDLNQCHSPNPAAHDHKTGRIFKVTYGEVKQTAPDLTKLVDEHLVDFQKRPDDWRCRTARRVLQERAAGGSLTESGRKSLRALYETPTANADLTKLHALWAMHVTGSLTEADLARALAEPQGVNTYAVAWAVQIACEEPPSSHIIDLITGLVQYDGTPVVHLYVAAALPRIPVEKRGLILAGLLDRGQEAKDHNLPLMDWYGLESICATEPDRALQLALKARIPDILGFTIRRLAKDDAGIAKITETLSKINYDETEWRILNALNVALKGRRNVKMPPGWDAIEPTLLANGRLKTEARALSVTFGSKTALDAMRKTLADAKTDEAARKTALESLLGAKDPQLAPVLQSLLTDPTLRGAAIRGLAAYDDANTPKAILARYSALDPAEKKDALVTLASRAPFAKALLAAADAGTIAHKELSADIVRQLRNLHDAEVDKQVKKVWGTLRDSPQEKIARMKELRQIILDTSNQQADPSHGRLLFTRTCSQCHTLFDSGGHVGPDITGADRASINYLVENTVDPNAIIPADYQASIIDTKDGRTIVGIVKKQDAHAITVITQNETLTLPRAEIEQLRPSKLSMMPEGLLDKWSRDDLRDLFAYLRGPRQVPLPVGADAGQVVGAAVPVAAEAARPATTAPTDDKAPLFNGKDLSNWDDQGAKGLWSVQDGEIVGKTEKGLKQNQFLMSKRSYGDFRLIVKIKLVPNEGNSGIQFHSEPFHGNEMSGPQADAGKGWWGKVYGENFGNKVIGENKSGEQVVKPNEWNTYEIVAVGTKIRTAINGHLCADIDDAKYDRKGRFGLQVHAGGPTEVRFKDFEFEENPKFELKTVK